MRYFNVLDVREREGKKPAYENIGTLYWNDETGKISLYLPMTGRFYPVKEQQARQVRAAAPPQPSAAPPTMPGAAPDPNAPPYGGDPGPGESDAPW